MIVQVWIIAQEIARTNFSCDFLLHCPSLDYSAVMNALNVIRQKLEAAGPAAWQEVSDASGVPLSTIQKIAHGYTEDPRIGTLQPLFEFYNFCFYCDE